MFMPSIYNVIRPLMFPTGAISKNKVDNMKLSIYEYFEKSKHA